MKIKSLPLQVYQAVKVLLVLQALVLKERREAKEQQVNQDHLVALVTLAHEVRWSVHPIMPKYFYSVHLESQTSEWNLTQRFKFPVRVFNAAVFIVVVVVIDRVKTEHQAHLDKKASWGKLVLQDLLVRAPVR